MITTVGPGIMRRPSRIDIPAGALVVLIGAAASGKSTFAARHFVADCVVASDTLREETTGAVSDEVVFAELHRLVQARLAGGLLAVVDATNTDWMWRAELLTDARRDARPAIAIVFHLPLEVCPARNAARSRTVPASVIRRQVADVTRDVERLDLEGFAAVYILRSVADVDAVSLEIEEGPVTRALDS
jgi:protein phosphatase